VAFSKSEMEEALRQSIASRNAGEDAALFESGSLTGGIKPRKKGRKAMASKKRKGLPRRSGKSNSLYACAYCSMLFSTKDAAIRHENSKHGGVAKPTRKIRPHGRLTAKCRKCGRVHFIGEHHSHGRGSFERTHG
jgi:uncharacterized C2H2 Zn-finger protein